MQNGRSDLPHRNWTAGFRETRRANSRHQAQVFRRRPRCRRNVCAAPRGIRARRTAKGFTDITRGRHRQSESTCRTRRAFGGGHHRVSRRLPRLLTNATVSRRSFGYRVGHAMQIDRKYRLATSSSSRALPWLAELDKRETQIALVARNGLSAKEIARQFALSPTTISDHLTRVYRRLAIYSCREFAMLWGDCPTFCNTLRQQR